ncbi:hypothetical protein OPV22_008529 [Ensete ventricosum]|uniref:Uncharacterized protein n=1 Tax=Ensete ventricosum TaxID=4639 RepID=A0AAV8RBA3_ENSVE|nr:hypothetical protein OPV22_008529 [Ensete ventricosum]
MVNVAFTEGVSHTSEGGTPIVEDCRTIWPSTVAELTTGNLTTRHQRRHPRCRRITCREEKEQSTKHAADTRPQTSRGAQV